MADAEIIDVDAEVEVARKDPKTNSRGRPKSSQNRKRLALSLENLSAQEKEVHIEVLQKELDGLLRYYKEVKDQKVDVELSQCGSRNAVIAILMEESELPLSRLVDQIYEKLKTVGNGVVADPVTHASVKSSVLFVGQRLMYGVPNADADVLEDDSESCCWCWEVTFLPSILYSSLLIYLILYLIVLTFQLVHVCASMQSEIIFSEFYDLDSLRLMFLVILAFLLLYYRGIHFFKADLEGLYSLVHLNKCVLPI